MKKLDGFLEIFKNLGSSQLVIRQNFIETVKKLLNYPIELKAVVYKNSIISIQTAPTVRSAIMMKKGRILEELEKLNPGKVKDIR